MNTCKKDEVSERFAFSLSGRQLSRIMHSNFNACGGKRRAHNGVDPAYGGGSPSNRVESIVVVVRLLAESASAKRSYNYDQPVECGHEDTHRFRPLQTRSRTECRSKYACITKRLITTIVQYHLPRRLFVETRSALPNTDPFVFTKDSACDSFLQLQQDPQGNYIARYVFPEKTEKFEVEVSVVADMAVINPFDFFVDEEAETFPFTYDPDLAEDLAPFRRLAPVGPHLKVWLDSFDRTPRNTVNLLVEINHVFAKGDFLHHSNGTRSANS